ncbi:MAG: tetratricopeptide repeat protein [Candidatus Omnitrophica bacterium]|nr:tetratricopeptide repeat protein [Candidatus Omnitrophota bacterium]
MQKRLYYFQKAIKYNPLLKQGYYEIGRTFDDLGQYEKALQNFQKAAQLDYRYNWAYFEVGRHLFEHGKPDDSLRYFLQSEQYERFYDELHYYLGQYYQYKQIFTGAQNHFSKAVKMNPDHVLAHHGLGMAEYELGNIEKVQQEIARLKALNRMDLAENLMELIEKK